jgi:hypothetical protein
MKLARPDVFHPRIVLTGAGNDSGLVTALRRRGLRARWLAWDDPDTLHADLVILRAARDHAERLDEFLRWIRSVANLLNPPDAVAWNLGEGYLRDLEDAGVPTQPGRPAQTALIFLGGQQSHAFTEKRSAEPEFDVWDIGHTALATAAECAGVAAGELLQARVDVNGDGLVGLDLVAPSLGWRRLDTGARELAQRGFAVAVESALDGLGLGPLSHRRP